MLKKVEYGNGYKVEYTHNQWGQPTYIYKNGVKKYGWSYDGAGAAYTYADYENKLKSQYTYDSLGRLVRFSTRDTSQDSATPKYYGEYQYDILNNASKFAYRAGGQTLTNSYTYGKDNLPETSVNSKLGTQTYYFDSLGRLDNKSPAAATGAQLKTQYYYKLSATRNTDGGSMYRSTRLGREEGNQHGTAYDYDVLGNITRVYNYDIELGKNTETARYTYDKKNQLIREDSKLQNKSITFAYDAGGNFASVKEYAYTTVTLGAVLKTTTYAYDTAWKDKLVSYNGTAITYDAIGNPLSYLGRTLTWEGRQLKTFTAGNTSASYKYDAQGLRSYKKVGTEESRYFYLGGKLAYEERGTKKFWYHYDALGALFALTYKNGTAAETSYLVYCNNRGDVEALYTMEGNLYARYNYDAWGNTVSITKLNGDAILPTATEIAYLNPIRYRGYYFDQESGLYYLESRYYDPQVKRFLSPDTTDVLNDDLMELKNRNLYAYCDNNPVVRADVGGEFWNVVIGAAVGAALGAGFEVASQLISGKDIDDLDWAAVFIEAGSGAAMGTLISIGVPAPILKASKVVINSATSVAHSINKGDDVLTTVGKAAFSATTSGMKNSYTPKHFSYTPKHYRATPAIKQVVKNGVDRGVKRVGMSGLGRLASASSSVVKEAQSKANMYLRYWGVYQ